MTPRTNPLLTSPWRPGPAAEAERGFVAVTRTKIHRFRDIPGVVVGSERLRRLIRSTEGAVGTTSRLELRRRLAWTLSMWESEQALRAFLASPLHAAIARSARAKLTVSSVSWSAPHLEREAAWKEGERRLAASEDVRVFGARRSDPSGHR